MASNGQDLSSSDEEIPKIRKRKPRYTRSFAFSSSSDSDSDVLKPAKKKKRPPKIRDSGSDSSLTDSSKSSKSKSFQKKIGKKIINSSNELSDNEQSEKCSICLCKFQGQDIASPEACNHVFCTECLLKWAKKMNTCPIDRKRFHYLNERNPKKPSEILRNLAFERFPFDFPFLCQACHSPGDVIQCSRCLCYFHSSCMVANSSEEQNNHQCSHRPRSEDSENPAESSGSLYNWLTSLRIVYHAIYNGQQQQRNTLENLSFRTRNLFNRLHHQNSQRTQREEVIRDRVFSTLRTDATHYSAPTPETRNHPLYTINDSSDESDWETEDVIQDRIFSSLRTDSTTVSDTRTHPVYTIDSSDGSDFGFEDAGGVLRRVHRNITRNKRLFHSSLNRSSNRSYRIPNINERGRLSRKHIIPPPEHSNFGLVNRHAVGRQQPMNPVQTTTAGSGDNNNHSTLPSSSSSTTSATSGASHHDLYSIPGCSLVSSNDATEGFDGMPHHIYGAIQDNYKDEAPVRAKDVRKSHSDDEVDLYGDIQYSNDNTDVNIDSVRTCSIEPPLPGSEATDSSDDNDLVIDEDLPVEEDNRNSTIESTAIESDGESRYEPEGIQSPDPIENSVQENNSHWTNESEASSEIVTVKTPTYVDSDMDSQEAQNITQSSFDMNINPDDDKASTPVVDENSRGDCDNANFPIDTEELVKRFGCINNSDVEMNETDEMSKCENIFEADVNKEMSDENRPSSEISDNQLNSSDNVYSPSDHNNCDENDLSKPDIKDDSLENDIGNYENKECINTNLDYIQSEKENSKSFEIDDDDNAKAETEIEKIDEIKDTNEHNESIESQNEATSTNIDEQNEPVKSDAETPELKKDSESLNSDDEKNKQTDDEKVDFPSRNIFPKNQLSNSDRSNNFLNSKHYNNANSFFAENLSSGIREFPTKASLKECLPIEGEFDMKVPVTPIETNTFQNIDLDIEDISDAASDDLNQLDDGTSEPMDTHDTVEKNVAKLFESEEKHKDFSDDGLDDSKRYASSASQQSLIEDQEEGEIIEDVPYHHRKSSRREPYIHDDDEFIESAPRINISSLPRIPKIKRDIKPDIPEELPLEAKRTSVLGRVDLGSSDVGWKRLSKHTRERSYRDGRPKDETILFREREPKRDKKKKSNEHKNEQKTLESDKKKSDDRRHERDRSRDRGYSYDRKSDKSRSDHERNCKSDRSYSEKKDREKHSKHRERHEKEKSTKKDKYEPKRDRHDKSKDKNSRREESKHDREKLRIEDKYSRDEDRYHQREDSYEKHYEKSREREHKHKHKESKSENSKKCKDEKHHRTHSRDHHSHERREREVRKVDDKLKIVVEQKESRNKEKLEKPSDKRELKHEKKHKETVYHHERKKKETTPVDYSLEYAPIESKEIFAQGDSIIINVNFNRASPREVVALTSDEFTHDRKSIATDIGKSDSNFSSADPLSSKVPLTFLDSDKKSDVKRPTTPIEKNQANDLYWRDEDASLKSLPSDTEKIHEDENSLSPTDNFGADNPLTDSEDDILPENQLTINSSPKERPSTPLISEKGQDSIVFVENNQDSRRRSPPQPPSPPSPPDNDSYDPCEPTRSPSPSCQHPSPRSPPPAPTDRPKPPPSPILPPLPPEPEPAEVNNQEDGHHLKGHPKSAESIISSASTPVVSQDQNNVSAIETSTPSPGILQPPPRFMGHLASKLQSQPSPKTQTWSAPNVAPVPSQNVIFPSNHIQPVVQANFLSSHLPAVNFPPPHVSAPVLPATNSIPMTSQVRHLQINPHAVIPTNTLLPNVPLNHLALPQVPMNPQSVPMQQSMTMQDQHTGLVSHGLNLLSNTIPGITVSQHGNLVTLQNVTQLFSAQQPVTAATSQKSDKLIKTSPAKDRSEVIDMDVDSPYSPGDSPSIDSEYDYSPPTSPLPNKDATPTVKDAFDSLFSPERASGANKPHKNSRPSTNSNEKESKKQKLESKGDSNKNKHHSVRMHVVDKSKSKKEHSRKDLLSKFDESQLTILDELPSSAVEMQVKEKFLKKLNRQERVIEEVKLALKPYYKMKEVSKEEYKEILRKSVPKICHTKSGEINPQKVKSFIDSYVKKMKHHRKKSSKKHKSSKFS